MPDKKPQGEFQTSLLGFNKGDVLAYIDQLTEKAQKEQVLQQKSQEKLEQELEALRSDNELLLHKTREVCEKLTSTEKRTEDEQARAKMLAEQLLQLEEAANGYKTRLFTKEQEALVLKSDNTRLTELLSTRQQEIEAVRSEAESAKSTAEAALDQVQQAQTEAEQNARQLEAQRLQTRQQLEAERLVAEQQLEQERAAAQRQAEAAKLAALREVELGKAQLALRQQQEQQQVQAGAQQISDTVSLLRRQLDEVDARIAEATAQLQQATGAIYAALGETEQGLEQLGAQARQFPKIESAQTPCPEQPAPSKTAKARPAAPRPHRTLSDGLLDLLDRILKE